jgi:hypothetical protein
MSCHYTFLKQTKIVDGKIEKTSRKWKKKNRKKLQENGNRKINNMYIYMGGQN